VGRPPRTRALTDHVTTETVVAPPPSRSEPHPRTFPLTRPAPSPRWIVAGCLAVLTLVSLYLRTRALRVDFWVDEGISVGIAGHPLSQIPHLLREDGSPPLYYFLLHFWMQAFGHTESATHALSVVFALLAIPVAYWGGSSLFDRRTGLICAMFAAWAPYLTNYAQETRMYSLMALLALILAASFGEVYVRRRRRFLPVFVLSLAGVMYTHNWGLFLAIMSGAAFLFVVWRAVAADRRGLWLDALIGFGAAAILYLPWLPTTIYQAQHTGAPWDLPPTLWSLTQGLYFLVGGRGAAVALLLAAGGGLLALHERPGLVGDRVRTLLGAVFVLGAGTLILAWLYAKVSPAWAPRYLGAVFGPAVFFFGYCVRRGGRLGAAALILVAIFWVLDPQNTKPYWKEDAASVLAPIRPHVRPGTLVLSTQPEQVPVLAYYLPRDVRFATPLGAVPDPGVMDWRNALNKFRRSSLRTVLMPMLDSVPPGGRVLLVTPLNLAKAPLWMKLINRSTDGWTAALEHDHAFRRIAFQSPHLESGLGVRATLWLRRS
jgi:4-amino-4-deoxy-L-arabinose transferase-like glycosyltransferase